ncbi:OmpA family protein [Pseudomonas chlororaphis]|uniref:OmpA family protein n=1 Tax=Pseudomonas chlororaphis TaxID=587753 RepID=A0AAX3G264_9PSED|nr:OmpA family protein [Pseudomonas chlororaphis]AVO57609.1 OmpA family protein [Pseudomonas chlororaphis subsp. piscium]AZC35734.1 Outer membrane protein [Pseudomonas chlororaphis subsp. piscium]AZC42277.1 Outer membrane protein [Pseudomonas chlororaphis subsp. piscium]AZC48928.1 Outer membrane protein [Pseudomonas chlororaphis subsp. piscium]AZC55556.1 Outer membrane protein [Pseudomonas chlororaphis subsp. piscium]
MSSNKSLALALCLTVTGCAQTPQNDAEGGHWWSFGSDKAASKEAVQPAAKAAANEVSAAKSAATSTAKSATAPAAAKVETAAASAAAPAAKAETTNWWWPFPSKDTSKDAVKEPVADAKADAATAAPKVAKTETGNWWWPFNQQPTSPTKADVKDIPMPDPKITQAWLDDYEPRLREAVKDSRLQLERRENYLVVIAPVDGSFNPDRPAMLLPVTLSPFTRVAKAVGTDAKTSVLVLGHADTTGAAAANQKLSRDRAQSVAAIFSLTGLKRDRLMLRGMGSVMPRAANDSVEGRALNRRVEIIVTQRNTMLALLSKYNQPTPSEAELVAVQDVKPVVPAASAKKAVAAKKAAPAKKAPAKKPVAKKEAAKKTTTAKAPAKAATEQAKN